MRVGERSLRVIEVGERGPKAWWGIGRDKCCVACDFFECVGAWWDWSSVFIPWTFGWTGSEGRLRVSWKK